VRQSIYREKAYALHAMLKDQYARDKSAFSFVAAQKPNGDVVDVVAAAGRTGRLTGQQRSSLMPWEVEAELLPEDAPLHDAEIKALAYIRKQGWKPLAGGTSRPICPWCENAIRGQNGELVGQTYPSTQIWRQSQETFIFPG
jgi:hypothetical protein